MTKKKDTTSEDGRQKRKEDTNVNITVSLEGVIDDLKLIYKSSLTVVTPDEDKGVGKTRGTYVRVDCSTNQLKTWMASPQRRALE